jgi:flagellar biosynthesis GTPase FlhF
MMLTNYAAAVEEENQELRRELKAAIANKQAAERLSAKDKQLAKDRLEKWHTERYLRQVAEDYAAEQQKAAKEADRIVKSYEALIEEDTKRKLQKEWADEEAAHRRGGARRWPIWVVQLICELLVNGTAPSAIPANIQTMYETLYGETPSDVPSVNFVRQCRVVVEVIGETITALKLAAAENWDALWTDSTTRRQIPFAALVIGLLGDGEAIDPVIVSSCIFMEDERSETQADGIVSKVTSLQTRANMINLQLTLFHLIRSNLSRTVCKDSLML